MSLTTATAELFEVPRARPARRASRPVERPGARSAPAPAGPPAARVDAGRETDTDRVEPGRGAGSDTSWARDGGPAPAGGSGRGGGSGGPGAAPLPPPSRAVVQLLEAARDELRTAQDARLPAERFRCAHLGALRAAAAVLALRARSRRSSRPTDAWTLLSSVAPEYAEWAAFFAAHSTTRSAVEAGVRGRVSQRDADDMVRQADLFLALVTRTVAGRAGA